jgi:hypothetical protein
MVGFPFKRNLGQKKISTGGVHDQPLVDEREGHCPQFT